MRKSALRCDAGAGPGRPRLQNRPSETNATTRPPTPPWRGSNTTPWSTPFASVRIFISLLLRSLGLLCPKRDGHQVSAMESGELGFLSFNRTVSRADSRIGHSRRLQISRRRSTRSTPGPASKKTRQNTPFCSIVAVGPRPSERPPPPQSSAAVDPPCFAGGGGGRQAGGTQARLTRLEPQGPWGGGTYVAPSSVKMYNVPVVVQYTMRCACKVNYRRAGG